MPRHRSIVFWYQGIKHYIESINLINLIALDCMHYYQCISVKNDSTCDPYVFEYDVDCDALMDLRNRPMMDVCNQHLAFFEQESPDFMWGNYYPTREIILHGNPGRRIYGVYDSVVNLSNIILDKMNTC